VAVGGDVKGVEPSFAVFDFAVGMREIASARAQGFNFRRDLISAPVSTIPASTDSEMAKLWPAFRFWISIVFRVRNPVA